MFSKQRQGQGHGRGGPRGHGGGRGRGGRGGYNSKGKGWTKTLFENMSGFLCSCNDNEKDCAKEALNLLNEYFRDEGILILPTSSSELTKSGSPKKIDDIKAEAIKSATMDISHDDGSGGGVDKDHDDDDIEKALKTEIAELKSDTVRSRFFSVDTGVRNLIFIRSTVQDPALLGYRILEDVTSTKALKARFLLRMVPIEITCRAYLDQVEGVCRRIFPKYFARDFTTFQIVIKSRYNGNLDKKEVIKVLASLVCEINPLNVVDLTNPTYSIIIEIIRNIVCIGILKDYNKFKRFNLHEVVAHETEKKCGGGPGSGALDTNHPSSEKMDTGSALSETHDSKRAQDETDEHDMDATNNEGHVAETSSLPTD